MAKRNRKLDREREMEEARFEANLFQNMVNEYLPPEREYTKPGFQPTIQAIATIRKE